MFSIFARGFPHHLADQLSTREGTREVANHDISKGLGNIALNVSSRSYLTLQINPIQLQPPTDVGSVTLAGNDEHCAIDM
jgi:hypothetical protein